MKQLVTVVDAFSDKPFKGNPAAVCVLESHATDTWMQFVAAEMNLSETAFLVKKAESHYSLRWFTPTVEVDLCGHATLASAHVLFESGQCADAAKITFSTRSGDLFVEKRDSWLWLDFPSTPPQPKNISRNVIEALGVEPVAQATGRTVFDDFVEVESEEVLRSLAPDMAKLKLSGTRGCIVTTRGKAPYDFVSRYFNPGAGIPEDPVTGSIHCALTPYWAAKLGKKKMLAYQASARGGVLKVEDAGARTHIGGQAITTLVATLHC